MNVEDYWTDPPPQRTEKAAEWLRRIEAGWRPNRRVRKMGYHEAARFYRVYIWEYLNLIAPALRMDHPR